MNNLWDAIELPWKPFGLTLTYKEWDELVTWYVQKDISERLDIKEEQRYAQELYSKNIGIRSS